MTEIWVCTNCKSINRARDTRCYSCGLRKDEAAASPEQTPTVAFPDSLASRAIGSFHSSQPFAIAAGVLMAASALLGIALLLASRPDIDALRDAFVQAIRTGDDLAANEILASQQRLSSTSAIQSLLYLLSLIAFGVWLRRVRLNIPALGAGTPGWGPWKALIYPILPVINVFLTPGKIHDALVRLDRRGEGGLGLVVLGWIAFVGTWIIGLLGGFVLTLTFSTSLSRSSTVDGFASAFGSLINQSFNLSLFAGIVSAVGALILCMLIAQIESRSSSRADEIRAELATVRVAEPGGPAPSTDAPPAAP